MNREELLDIMGIMKVCIPSKPVYEIFGCFCFDSEAKNITAFNGQQAIIADIETDLDCAIPGDLFYGLLSSYAGKDISIKQKDDEVHLVGTGSKGKLPTLSKEKYVFKNPLLDKPSEAYTLQLPEDFVKGIKKCLISASVDHRDVFQCGVTIRKNGPVAHIYSTNNNSISSYVLDIDEGAPDFNIFIPRTFCDLLINVATKKSFTKVYRTKDSLIFEYEGILLYTKTLIDEDNFDFEGILETFNTETSVFKELSPDIVEILIRSVIINTSELVKKIEITVTPENIEFKTETSSGVINDVIPCENNFTLPDTIKSFVMDTNFMKEAVKETEEFVFMGYTDANSDNQVVYTGLCDKFKHYLLSYSITTV